MCRGLAISTVPAAAPAMMISSAGCIRTSRFPFSIRYPATIAPNTTTIPIIENIRYMPQTTRTEFACAAVAASRASSARANSKIDGVAGARHRSADGDGERQPVSPPGNGCHADQAPQPFGATAQSLGGGANHQRREPVLLPQANQIVRPRAARERLGGRVQHGVSAPGNRRRAANGPRLSIAIESTPNASWEAASYSGRPRCRPESSGDPASPVTSSTETSPRRCGQRISAARKRAAPRSIPRRR